MHTHTHTDTQCAFTYTGTITCMYCNLYACTHIHPHTHSLSLSQTDTHSLSLPLPPPPPPTPSTPSLTNTYASIHQQSPVSWTLADSTVVFAQTPLAGPWSAQTPRCAELPPPFPPGLSLLPTGFPAIQSIMQSLYEKKQ